jgi:ABC-type amino acid transport substrate-binding protein
MQKRGVDYTIFAPKDHGFDFYTGFSVEYLEKLAKMAGFKIQWDSRDDWDKAVSDFKYKKVDLLHAISKTEERKHLPCLPRDIFEI